MNKSDNWKRKFYIVAAGQAISMLGSSGVQFALIWWLAEKTASPLIMGLSGFVAFLPMAILSPFAGVAADRYNRKFISIMSDMTMGIIAMVFAVLLLFMELPVWAVIFMLGARGAGTAFQQPAIQSIIPQLVPKEYLVKTNGFMQLLNSGSFLIGPVIGAALYAAFPMSVVLLSDVIGAALASIALAVVKIPKLERKIEEQHFIEELKVGFHVFLEDKKYMRYKLTIEYDGTSLLGWQRQLDGPSVQQYLEEILAKLNGFHREIVSAGRTDAGVHALGQVAHIDLEREMEPWKIREAFNGNLQAADVPVSVLAVEAVVSPKTSDGLQTSVEPAIPLESAPPSVGG